MDKKTKKILEMAALPQGITTLENETVGMGVGEFIGLLYKLYADGYLIAVTEMYCTRFHILLRGTYALEAEENE